MLKIEIETGNAAFCDLFTGEPREFDEAIEKKQVTEQQTQQAKYELEKAKVENEKKVENAKAEAEVMKSQNREITDKTLELKKLDPETPVSL